ncbi:Porphobilinogen deaminase [Diplonema papillatum]|nr:Porphobilinogen deaminase [Diplonema papillatum]
MCSDSVRSRKSYKPRKIVRVGSRKSPLAMVQTNLVVAKLKEQHPELTFEVVTLETKGDKVLDKALSAIGDKGLFTQELEEKMHSSEIDMAVHSCKDLQSTLPDGLCIGAFLKRDPREDVFVASKRHAGVKCIDDLPKGAVVGTSSVRRRAVLSHHHPHLQFKDIRGNIGTRLNKLDDDANGYDGTILAHAGLVRMQEEAYSSRITQVLPEEKYMYAVAQGVIAVECRDNDSWLLGVLDSVQDPDSKTVTLAERALLRGLEGGCHVPLATRALKEGRQLTLHGAVFSVDGTKSVKESMTIDLNDMSATELGRTLSVRMAEKGAKELIAACK